MHQKFAEIKNHLQRLDNTEGGSLCEECNSLPTYLTLYPGFNYSSFDTNETKERHIESEHWQSTENLLDISARAHS